MGKLFAVYAVLICLNLFSPGFGVNASCGQLCRSENCLKTELNWEHCPKLPKLNKQISLATENKHFTKVLAASTDSVQALQLGEDQLRAVAELGWRVRNETMNLTPAKIKANRCCFGARRDFETLSQLILYDNIRSALQIVRKEAMADGSKTLCSGNLLDTSRNVVCVELRKINQNDMVQLNALDGFITDKLSFPLENKSHSKMSGLHRYIPPTVYTCDVVVGIVNYGCATGIRFVPDFNALALVGEGSVGCQSCSEKTKNPIVKESTWSIQPANGPSLQEYLVKYRNIFKHWIRAYNLQVLENLKRDIRDFPHPNAWHGGSSLVSTNSRWSSLYKCLKCVWKHLAMHDSLPRIAQN